MSGSQVLGLGWGGQVARGSGADLVHVFVPPHVFVVAHVFEVAHAFVLVRVLVLVYVFGMACVFALEPGAATTSDKLSCWILGCTRRSWAGRLCDVRKGCSIACLDVSWYMRLGICGPGGYSEFELTLPTRTTATSVSPEFTG